MDHESDLSDLDDAIRRARAGLKALEGGRSRAAETGRVYPTHLHLATVELAHAIEVAMKVALRNQ